MPKQFDDAVKAGSPVITRKLKGGKYQHFVKSGKEWIAGEIKTKKGEK